MGSIRRIAAAAEFLTCPLEWVQGVKPLPWLERLTTRTAVPGEKIMLAPPTEWLGRKWEVRIGSVKNTIYKVALETTLSDRASAEQATVDVVTRLGQEFGAPTQPDPAVYMWDADDGNAVMQLANVGGERRSYNRISLMAG